MTECIAPGTVNDEQLAAYALDPELVDAVARKHIVQCTSCKAEVRLLRSFQQVMSQSLFRLNCPTVEQIDAYVSHELAAPEENVIAAHVQECLRCQEEVAITRRALLPIAQEPPATRERIPLFAALATLLPERAPAVALRGNNEKRRLRYLAGSYELILSLVPIRGQVTIYGEFREREGAEVTDAVVRLFQLPADEAHPLAVEPVEQEAFKLGPLDHGTYQMEVQVSEYVVVIPATLTL